jgi:hypothetical protein
VAQLPPGGYPIAVKYNISYHILPKFCLTFFILFFEDRNFGVNSDKILVDLLTFKCKEQIPFYEGACATVIEPKTGVLNLLLCHRPLLTKMYLNT